MHETVRCRIIVVLDLALRRCYAHSHELSSIARGAVNGGLELLLGNPLAIQKGLFGFG